MEIAFYSYYAKLEWDTNSKKIWGKYSLGNPRDTSFDYLDGYNMMVKYFYEKYSLPILGGLRKNKESIKTVDGNLVTLPDLFYLYGIKDLLAGIDFMNVAGAPNVVSKKFINLLQTTNFRDYMYFPVRVFLFDRFGTPKDPNEPYFKAIKEYKDFNFDYLNDNIEYTDSYFALEWTGEAINGFSKDENNVAVSVSCNPSEMPAIFQIEEFKGRQWISVDFFQNLQKIKLLGLVSTQYILDIRSKM